MRSNHPTRIFATVNGSRSAPLSGEYWLIGGWEEKSRGNREAQYVRADIADAVADALKGLLAANDAVQMVLCDGPEVPGFDPSALGNAQRTVTAAEDMARIVIAKFEARP